ncbi:GLUG motif-containing protein [Caproicibacter sp.]|uniref:GLUG motif-containing protein n=1 Tax=Caproicibacter sp. TaxID=2814884 RepID=UPI0039895E16
MQTQEFADTLNANIDSLNLSDCACWKYDQQANNGFPVLEGVGNGIGGPDTVAPTVVAYAFQDYTSGKETIHTSVLDDNSGIAIRKYAEGVQEVSYFTEYGTLFNNPLIDGLTMGTYTIYAKDRAGNETVEVVAYSPSSGSGTVANPYIITTAAQLAAISTGLGNCYKLGNDIDLSSFAGWTPIGSNSKPFTGTFDGGGHTITNLTIGTESNPNTSSYQGLFGYINAATIENVGITNASIYSSGDYIGALIGYCTGTGTVKNAHMDGYVSGNSHVGGLIGYVSSATILNSYTSGQVSGSTYVGGLIGNISSATILNSYATDQVTGSGNYTGGLVGQNTGTVTNSYATGSVTGASYVGGFVGYNSSGCKITNSYAVCSVSGNSAVGCLVGYNYGTVTDGYWKTIALVSGCGGNSGTFTATEMSAADMQTQTFADTLNANISSLSLTFCVSWKYYSGVNSGFPVLQGIGDGNISSDTTPPTIAADAFQSYNDGTETIQTNITDDSSGIDIQKYASGTQAASYFALKGTAFNGSTIKGLTIGTYTIYAKDNAGNEAIMVVTFTPVSGSGSSSDPYVITSAAQLAGVSTGLGKYYKLGNNIDLSVYSDWTPIGSNTASFTGNFDGDGHTISNLKIGTESEPSTLSYLGLFGAINGATIKNLHVNASIYSSSFDIGGIAGYVSGAASIANSYVTGSISGGSYVGGLAGNVLSSTATISNSYSTANVAGSSNYIGGLIGGNAGTVTNCYAKGNVSGDSSLGGLFGQNRGTTINCYAKGNVSGVSNLGGLAGQNSGTITNCYAVGSVSGTSNVGGFVGYNSSKIINSYASGSVTGNSITGGFAGRNTSSVTSGYWNITAMSSGCGSTSGTFAATGMALADMQTLGFAYALSTNIDDLGLTGCVDWKYVNATPVLQGIGDGVATADSTPPTINAYEYQNYTTGKEEIHATIYDDNSGIAIQKVLAGEHTAGDFKTGGTTFTGVTINDLTVGTYTIYAKDNAGNEAVKVITYSSASGNGSESNPYIITTAGQLAAISTGLGKSYRLGKNIDLSGYTSWTPLGSSSDPFTGTFDGNGYKISNLTNGSLQVPSALSNLGLFGVISNATIKNVSVCASIYSSGDYIGALAGKSNSSSISDVYTFGTVSGNNYIGGLAGYCNVSTISGSSSGCAVTSTGNYAGGLVGSNAGSGSIINSYSTGNVSGTSMIGGIVGSNTGTVTNSYETGNVSGTSNIGGFAGSNSGPITNSYEAGGVSGTSGSGGFVGSNSGSLTDCYFNSTSNSTPGSSDVTGKSLSAMRSQSFADTLNSNIEDLDRSDCMDWEYDADFNIGLPSLDGVSVFETNSDGTTTTKETNSDGSTEIKTYDGNGNLISDKNSKNGTTTYTYDDDGVLQTETDPDGAVTTYNSDGTIADITDAYGNSIVYTYDSKGNLISKYDSEQGETTYTYHSNGAMETETDPDGTVTDFNDEGVVTSIKYVTGRSITYTYDNNGKLATLNDSMTGISTFTYDPNGNLATETDPDGTVISCNSEGKPALATRTDGSTITYAYDSSGNLVSTVDSKYGTTTYSYDSAGHRISETDPDGTVVTFDTTGKVTKATCSDGRTVLYEYDPSGNLSTGIDSLAGTYTYTYDENQNLTSVEQPNGQVVYYDSNGSVSSIQNSANNTSANRISYTYDSETGNIVGIYEDDVLKVSYQYDSKNELIREDNLWLNESIAYSYDENGNITNKLVYPYTTGTLGTADKEYQYEYGNSSNIDQLTSYDGNTLTYDSNGNLTAYNGWAYTWNGSNLSSAKNSGNAISYQYDSSGIRTSKTVNGVTTTYTLGKNNNVASQTDGTNILNFVYDTTGKLCYMTLNDVKYYYETNVQGDIIGLLDSSNHEVVTYQYDTWGKLISVGGNLASTVGAQNPFRYKGYYYDTESGLYYLQSRYYNPEISRFISKDDTSYHEGQTGINANLYAYANNNPVVYGDPDGHSVTSMVLNIASSVFSLVFAVNPATGGIKLGFALSLGAFSLAITIADYCKSINKLNSQLKNDPIAYSRELKVDNLWLSVGIGAAVITTVFTYLGVPKYAGLMSRTGMQAASVLSNIIFGHAISNVMWVNDMVSLMNGNADWF